MDASGSLAVERHSHLTMKYHLDERKGNHFALARWVPVSPLDCWVPEISPQGRQGLTLADWLRR